MTSESEAVMILPYEWILENIEEQTTTIASKMILFRGEKVFRVGLKNHAENPVLFIMAIELRKMGMEVRDVKYGMQDSGIGPAKMVPLWEECVCIDRSLQLFTDSLSEKVVGNRTIVFRILIQGTDHGYSYQLSDRLAKSRLWAALTTQKHLADVELIVKDKTFPVHKAILAARSRVFADEFEKKQPVKTVPHQIRIDGVQVSTVRKFLLFIYTGETMETLADEELLKLADHYQLKTLSGLCKVALKKTDAMHIANMMKLLNSNDQETSRSQVTPEYETKILCDRTTFTFCCSSSLDEKEESTCVMQYQNENIFIGYFTGKRLLEKGCKRRIIEQPVIHLSCAKHRNFGLKVEDIYCELVEDEWVKMESKYFQENAELLHVAAESPSSFYADCSLAVNFEIKMTSTIGFYYYEMMDKHWLKDLWKAATNQKWTDVEIFVGTFKVMEAHRVILCVRSPVLNDYLNKIGNTRKSIVTFGAEFDVEIVKNFLNFLYTGSLKTTDGGHLLGKLATMYQVETLKNVCQLLNASPPDAENLTDYILQL